MTYFLISTLLSFVVFMTLIQVFIRIRAHLRGVRDLKMQVDILRKERLKDAARRHEEFQRLMRALVVSRLALMFLGSHMEHDRARKWISGRFYDRELEAIENAEVRKLIRSLINKEYYYGTRVISPNDAGSHVI